MKLRIHLIHTRVGSNCVIIRHTIDVRRVAANNIVLRVYLIECLPMRKRGTCLAIIDMFWIVGYLSALGNRMCVYLVSDFAKENPSFFIKQYVLRFNYMQFMILLLSVFNSLISKFYL